MQPPAERHRVTVVIVAGFLGSGKTTLIRDLLPQLTAGHFKPYVILNDFANAAIDAHSLRGRGAEIKALAAGCVCCDDADGLIRAILAIPTTHPALLFIEANGTTDPYRLIETITLTPSSRDVVGHVLQVTVVNEARWGKRWLPGDRQTERAQARTASVILTNRGEKASAKQRQAVVQDLTSLNPHAPILTFQELLDRLLQGGIEQSLPSPEISQPTPHRHLHVALQIDLPMMTEDHLRHWLLSLPREVLRVKGLARISEKEMAYFQRTDDALETPRIVKTKFQDSIVPAAVLIGSGIQEESIRASLYVLYPTEPRPFSL
jgi:G3E family GTPase